MVRLTKISLYQLPDLIKLSYEGDNDLLSKFHIAPMGLEEATYSTFQMIKNASLLKHLDCYKVLFGDKQIGYVVTYEDNNLYSYGITIKYRKKDILIEWFDKVKKLLSKDFISMLYDNNTRAADFLLKNNMKVLNHDKENHVITFVNA